ncbi:unnamed protein product [Effrenium voratum]|nr:unnamed protein product [Effrenium voratum]
MATQLAGPTDEKLDAILKQLSESADAVPVEQLQSLQKQAEAAGEQLKKDNQELRDTLNLLKGRRGT